MSGTVLGDTVYEVIMRGRAQQQAILNVLYYRVTAVTTTASALDLATEFEIDVKPAIVDNLHTNYSLDTVEVRRLDNLTDFAEVVSGDTGGVAGERLPLHDALVIKLIREDKTTRNGRKSLGPISEDQVSNGDLNASGLTDANAMAAFLEADIVTAAATYTPVIVGNKRDAQGQLNPESQWQWNTITSAVVIDQISTQNSRKRRQGV